MYLYVYKYMFFDEVRLLKNYVSIEIEGMSIYSKSLS